MRDIFYTILVVWIIWRVLNSIRACETIVESSPPVKNKISDDEGEYVDYDEVKS